MATTHTIGTRQAWFAARLELLEAEKALTRQSDDYQCGGHAMDAVPAPAPVVEFAGACGTDAPTYSLDRPGMSAFVLEDGVVYHTYSTYGRGVDALWSMYQWLDRAPKGRNETGVWWRRHDEYGKH